MNGMDLYNDGIFYMNPERGPIGDENGRILIGQLTIENNRLSQNTQVLFTGLLQGRSTDPNSMDWQRPFNVNLQDYYSSSGDTLSNLEESMQFGIIELQPSPPPPSTPVPPIPPPHSRAISSPHSPLCLL